VAAYSASFLISGRSAAVILWHPMHRSTDGMPAYSERRASLWQYWQSTLYVSTWTLCGNWIGCAEGLATAERVSLQSPLPDPGAFNVTVTKAGTGQGAVSSSPGGLNCGIGCASATAPFPTGTLVALSPTAGAGSAFADWSGDGDCVNGVVVADRNKGCTARFEPAVTLAVTTSGTGAGRLTSRPAGIDCGADCTEDYALGTPVTLTATPAPGSVFDAWGGACSGTNTCALAMDAAKSVTASFTKVPGSSFYDVTPCRVADTREAQPGPALQANEQRLLAVANRCGVPSDAKAISLNVTVTAPTDPGNLRVFPAGLTAPLASALNYGAGQTRANNVVVALGDGGAVVVLCEQASGTAHVIVDVNGYFE